MNLNVLCSILVAASSPQVIDVHDGDTVLLESSDGFRVKTRLIGIDCPEVPSKERRGPRGKKAAPGQPLGIEARDRLATLLKSPFEIKAYGLDAYGRSLVEFKLKAGKVVNEVLVEEGFCEFYKKARAKGFDKKAYPLAEAKARAAKKGIWALPHYEPPGVYRRRYQ